MQPVAYSRLWQARRNDCLSNRHRFPVVHHPAIDSPVILLFCLCRPLHVTGLITKSIVDPFKRMTIGRALAYMRQKRLKVALPFITYGDAPPPVIVKMTVLWVSAPRLHVGPCPILRRPRHSVF